MTQSRTPPRRCAIYTRKSSEEGLEQEFNSLHAQRDACTAFIASQKGEGWKAIDTLYDDGGFSGGTMERPALQRLLADARERRIDIVVVYKVDRLTRSLSDFAKIVELFDANGISFVSVTQQFNTTSSMGRLTLNILLSFAQFEREIAGERIRDKVAASKRKGMWMGGHVPLGYDIQDRRLVIDQTEAETVRFIYRRYLELGSVRLLQEDLEQQNIRSKIRVSPEGARSGGQSFGRGALYTLLANPIYIGEIRHKTIRHPGLHEPILDRALWDEVQRDLRDHGPVRQTRSRKTSANLLAGKLYDEHGGRLTPSHAIKKGRRYRYYVSRALVIDVAKKRESGWRLPAEEIETIVIQELARTLADRTAIADAIREAGGAAADLPAVLKETDAIRSRLDSITEQASIIAAMVERVDLRQGSVLVMVSLAALLRDHRDAERPNNITITRTIPMSIRRRGVEMKMVIETADPLRSNKDPVLLKTIAKAHRWFARLAAGDLSITEMAAREGLTHRSISTLLPLAFLAPEIVEAIANGHQPPDLTAKKLVTRVDLPIEWRAQKQVLGIR